MKKILVVIVAILLLGGCDMSKMTNTPTKKVEMFFDKYQTLNKDVLKDLDKIIAEEEKFNNEDRSRYREIMKKHYQNLRYSIKDEEIDGDKAIVTVEIEVVDYSKVLQDSEKYLEENPDKFTNDKGEYSAEKFMKYRLDELEKAKDEVKYTLKMKVTKEGENWKLDPIDKETEQKIHGVYIY